MKDTAITQGNELDLRALIVESLDAEGNDLIDQVTIEDQGGFDKDTPGQYQVTYKVVDKNGMTVRKTATVTVKKKTIPQPQLHAPTPIRPAKILPKTGEAPNLLTYLGCLLLFGFGLILKIKKLYGDCL